MYQQILLPVALQQWEEFTPHALAAREVAAVLAKGSGAKLSVLSVYDYGKIKEPGLYIELAARYREDMMQRTDALMETKMKDFLAGVQEMDIDITPMVGLMSPARRSLMAERLPADLLIIGAHSKRSVFNVALGGTAAYVSATPLSRAHGDAEEKALDTRDTPIADRPGHDGENGRVCALKRRDDRGKGYHPTAARTPRVWLHPERRRPQRVLSPLRSAPGAFPGTREGKPSSSRWKKRLKVRKRGALVSPQQPAPHPYGRTSEALPTRGIELRACLQGASGSHPPGPRREHGRNECYLISCAGSVFYLYRGLRA
jgi:nucleotide-binding universal stress UspA family protein